MVPAFDTISWYASLYLLHHSLCTQQTPTLVTATRILLALRLNHLGLSRQFPIPFHSFSIICDASVSTRDATGHTEYSRTAVWSILFSPAAHVERLHTCLVSQRRLVGWPSPIPSIHGLAHLLTCSPPTTRLTPHRFPYRLTVPRNHEALAVTTMNTDISTAFYWPGLIDSAF
jgi:hypothetical protein